MNTCEPAVATLVEKPAPMRLTKAQFTVMRSRTVEASIARLLKAKGLDKHPRHTRRRVERELTEQVRKHHYTFFQQKIASGELEVSP